MYCSDVAFCQITLTTWSYSCIQQWILTVFSLRPPSRAGHSMFIRWFLLSLFFFFSLAYSHQSQTGCLPYFHTWCGLSANLETMSEMCCTRLAENAGCRNIAKESPSGHHRTTLSGNIFATKACIDNLKKLVKQQYLLHMSSQYGELRPISGLSGISDYSF